MRDAQSLAQARAIARGSLARRTTPGLLPNKRPAAPGLVQQFGAILEARAVDETDRRMASPPGPPNAAISASTSKPASGSPARQLATQSSPGIRVVEEVGDERQRSPPAAPPRRKRASGGGSDQNRARRAWLWLRQAPGPVEGVAEIEAQRPVLDAAMRWNKPHSVLYLMSPMASGPTPSAPPASSVALGVQFEAFDAGGRHGVDVGGDEQRISPRRDAPSEHLHAGGGGAENDLDAFRASRSSFPRCWCRRP